MKLLSLIIVLLLPVVCANAQAHENKREDEIALGIKVVTGEIKYGSSDLYVTDVGAISIQPGLRYDYPVKISGKQKKKNIFPFPDMQVFYFARQRILTYFILIPKTLPTSPYMQVCIIAPLFLLAQNSFSGKASATGICLVLNSFLRAIMVKMSGYMHAESFTARSLTPETLVYFSPLIFSGN